MESTSSKLIGRPKQQSHLVPPPPCPNPNYPLIDYNAGSALPLPSPPLLPPASHVFQITCPIACRSHWMIDGLSIQYLQGDLFERLGVFEAVSRALINILLQEGEATIGEVQANVLVPVLPKAKVTKAPEGWGGGGGRMGLGRLWKRGTLVHTTVRRKRLHFAWNSYDRLARDCVSSWKRITR